MRRVKEAVPMQECQRRAHAALTTRPTPASAIANAIWPQTEWRAAQGAGAAASRVLKAMSKVGLAHWTVRGEGAGRTWGWVRIGRFPNNT